VIEVTDLLARELEAGDDPEQDKELATLLASEEETPVHESVRAPSAVGEAAAPRPPAARVTGLSNFVGRAEWGARLPKAVNGIPGPVYGIAYHYEGPTMGVFDHSRCAGKVRGIQDFHMDTRGWSDIAYTAVICPHGFIFEGRWAGVRTAANGTNSGNDHFYALCFLGGVGDPFPIEGKRAFVDATAWLRINSAGNDIKPHSWFKPTSCPGDAIRDWIAAGCPTDGPPTPPPFQGTGWFRAAHPTVAQGARNDTVRHVQHFLGVAPDGIFGPHTRTALETFQRRAGIGADGICGPETWSRLHPLLKEGARGDRVLEVQREVDVAADGIFGPATREAVRAFQRGHRLADDGIVGPQTYRRMFP
jgi:peptidoglycan hydrolase-like protein with peptidoglycan-binding domain